MTSRERVLSALDHREPDRVPIDFSGHRSSGVAAVVYPKLRECLGLPATTIRVDDPIQQLAIVDEDVLERFGVDTIEMGRGFALDEASWADWTLPDGTPCKMPARALPERREGEWVFRAATGRVIGRMPDGALFFEQSHWPFLEHDDPGHLSDAFAESMWTALRSPPGAPGLSAEDLSAGARRLRERSDRAIIGLFGGNLLETGQFLYRNDNFLMLLARELARVKIMLHCCAGVRTLLPHLIDAGLDAINPVQISCRGMDAAELKREFGKDLTFWGGGCDTREILPCGTPEQVRSHVREQVRILAPGGGFVFQQVHNIMANVPPDNIIAMFDAVRAP
jgi:uroporphyrinogen decarboxylase